MVGDKSGRQVRGFEGSGVRHVGGKDLLLVKEAGKPLFIPCGGAGIFPRRRGCRKGAGSQPVNIGKSRNRAKIFLFTDHDSLSFAHPPGGGPGAFDEGAVGNEGSGKRRPCVIDDGACLSEFNTVKLMFCPSRSFKNQLFS